MVERPNELLHQRLKENAQRLMDNKGIIGCPAVHLNEESAEWTVSCLQVCGSIFKEWRKVNTFKDNGARSKNCSCPCNVSPILIITEKWECVKDVFWAYVDKIINEQSKGI